MKPENILEAINNVDSELVEDAEGKHTETRKRVLLRWSALVACLILVVGLVWNALTPPAIPENPYLIYSAEGIANLFEQENAGPTSSYEKVYFPNGKSFSLNPIPDSEYLAVYRYQYVFEYSNGFNQEEFASFLNAYLPNITQVLGISPPRYTIANLEPYFLDMKVEDTGEYYSIGGSQHSLYQTIHFGGDWFENQTGEVFLDGRRLEIDQSQSDAEILASLEWAKEKLFSVFGVSFSDAKITRSYNDSGENGATSLGIYFYNKADNPINEVVNGVYSDYIRITFDNILNNENDVVSDTVIWDATISYRQYRVNPQEVYAPIGHSKMISLEQAEDLLAKGYVFGGHSCPLCMAEQEKVDFSTYDYVSLCYVSGKLEENDWQFIPFYAFYKEIGIANNGNVIYARTYVPAVEVSGYEEYFQNQEAAHS